MIHTLLLIAGSVLFIVAATTVLRMHPFLALILAALEFGLLSGMSGPDVIDAIAAGFGGTVGSIGIIILFGAIIGVFLERSGGALRLAESILRKTGDRHIPAAMGGVGYIVSMPVFCDTAFIILSSLNKALSKKANVGLAAGAVALSLGLYTTHTMVPPTPGPVAAAGILEADLGLVILWGIVVSLVALFAGCSPSRWQPGWISRRLRRFPLSQRTTMRTLRHANTRRRLPSSWPPSDPFAHHYDSAALHRTAAECAVRQWNFVHGH